MDTPELTEAEMAQLYPLAVQTIEAQALVIAKLTEERDTLSRQLDHIIEG